MIFKLAEAAEKSWRRLDGHNQLPKVILGESSSTKSRSSDRKLKPLPPDPFRHQNSTIAPSRRGSALSLSRQCPSALLTMSATYSYSGKRQCEIGALASTTGTNGGAPALQYSVAETFGVVLPGFRKFDDLASYDFVGNVAAINKPKRYRCHFICEAHDPEGLWVKLLAIEVRSDRHMRPPVPGGIYRTLSPRPPEAAAVGDTAIVWSPPLFVGLVSAQTRTQIRKTNGPQTPPNRPRLRDRQGPR